ncbi:non-specific lipid transfer protein GPI-anchored 15 [Malania oleifera]|uniref:non-specific lipid transfer protein GPI-anchored 15 n=1 Tax=Malania oleifera TaxID=397392 RepID=UPI0025AE2F11|nr:non-specific lipid transfer protein GPI-anchored 15 [Malania oleifera]
MASKVAAQLVAAAIIVLVVAEGVVKEVGAAGECGGTPINNAAASLSPCLGAAQNPRATVRASCCSKVSALIRTNPRCLCAVLLSPLAKQAGINLGIAITIPKRCNIRNRPAGKKCGKYTVP